MTKYIIRRILLVPLILLILSFLIFSLVSFLSPSERVAVFISNPEYMQDMDLDEIISRYNLDRAFYLQYFNWFKNVIRGKLGWSPSAKMPVMQALKLRIPATIELMFLGQLIIFMGGLILGRWSALNHNNYIDYIIRFLTILGTSLPGFVIGMVLLVFFYGKFKILGPGRLDTWAHDIVLSSQFEVYTGMNLIDSCINLRFDIFMNAFKHIILPSIAYSIGILSSAVRLFRSSLLEVLHLDYIKTARAKGVSEKCILTRHAQRNALLPYITFIGTKVPAMFGGTVIIETVFNYHGMGTFIVTAAQGLDFPAILGGSLFIGLMIIIINLIIDILYGVLDPSIKVE